MVFLTSMVRFGVLRSLWLGIATVSTVMGGQKVSFQLKDIGLKFFVEASVLSRPDGRYLHIAVVEDDASCASCLVESLCFEAVVEAEGKSAILPVEIQKDNLSGSGEMRIGSINVLEFRLRLTHARVLRPVPTKIYDGIVAEDDKCMRDAIDAMSVGGGSGRKALLSLIDTGCVLMTPQAMSAGVEAPAHLHLVRGKKVGYAYLSPLLPDDPHDLMKGWIIADKLNDGRAGEIVDLANGSEVGPIPIQH